MDIRFEQAAQAYCDYLKADYDSFTDRRNQTIDLGWSAQLDKPGQKFVRVVASYKDSPSGRSVQSFLVLKDQVTSGGLVLKMGDILKGASWKAPALNFVRGNIFDKGSYQDRCHWSGVS